MIICIGNIVVYFQTEDMQVWTCIKRFLLVIHDKDIVQSPAEQVFILNNSRANNQVLFSPEAKYFKMTLMFEEYGYIIFLI